MANAPVIEFRPAVAADMDAAVPLILSSGPDAFNYVFRTARTTPEAFLRHAFAGRGGEFGWGNHVVGVVEGRVVAAGAGWTSATNLPFMLAALRQFTGYFGPLPAAAALVRGLRTEAVVRPPAGGEYYIGHLGVDPALRGQGIGAALVEHLLEAGRAAGKRVAVLDVSVANPRAEALYARLGFKVTAERLSRLRSAYGFVPNHRRMERAP